MSSRATRMKWLEWKSNDSNPRVNPQPTSLDSAVHSKWSEWKTSGTSSTKAAPNIPRSSSLHSESGFQKFDASKVLVQKFEQRVLQLSHEILENRKGVDAAERQIVATVSTPASSLPIGRLGALNTSLTHYISCLDKLHREIGQVKHQIDQHIKLLWTREEGSSSAVVASLRTSSRVCAHALAISTVVVSTGF